MELPVLVDERKRQILEAAIHVFRLHGYAKTKMEYIAQATKLSRQGIYLHFPSKENLYAEMSRYVLERTFQSAMKALMAPGIPLQQRLVGAFDVWMGPYTEESSPHVMELLHFSRKLFGALMRENKMQFSTMVAGVLATSKQIGNCERHGVSPRRLADALYLMAEGCLSRGGTRQKFVENMTAAVMTVCDLMNESPRNVLQNPEADSSDPSIAE